MTRDLTSLRRRFENWCKSTEFTRTCKNPVDVGDQMALRDAHRLLTEALSEDDGVVVVIVKRHGIVSSYAAKGCRCQKCRAAWAEYTKARRRQRRVDRICLMCQKPSSKGRQYCDDHLAANKRALQRRLAQTSGREAE